MLEQVEGVMTGKRLQAILTAGDEPGERDSLAQESAMTTVLVVHRDRGNVAWLNDYLEKAGFRVVVAQDGLTGLNLVRRESPELILLNLTPPAPHGRSGDNAGKREMDGCEFLRRLRRESKAGVIALSRGTTRRRCRRRSRQAPTIAWPGPAAGSSCRPGCAPCCGAAGDEHVD